MRLSFKRNFKNKFPSRYPGIRIRVVSIKFHYIQWQFLFQRLSRNRVADPHISTETVLPRIQLFAAVNANGGIWGYCLWNSTSLSLLQIAWFIRIIIQLCYLHLIPSANCIYIKDFANFVHLVDHGHNFLKCTRPLIIWIDPRRKTPQFPYQSALFTTANSFRMWKKRIYGSDRQKRNYPRLVV